MDSRKPPSSAPEALTIAKPRVGIFADLANASVEECFETTLKLALRRHIPPFPISLTPLGSPKSREELRENMDDNFHAVVAMVGVQGSSQYVQDIHQLLDTWRESAHKPVMLIATNNTVATNQAINSWTHWETLSQELEKPVNELKKAIIVNKEYLVSQTGENALAEIQNAVTIAHTTARRPSHSVQIPHIQGMESTRHLTLV